MVWVALSLVFVFGSFLVWRRMREDYADDSILTFYLVLLAICVPLGFWKGEWAVVLAGLAVLGWWTYKYSWNFWDWLEMLGPAVLLGSAILMAVVGRWQAGAVMGIGWAAVMIIRPIHRSFKWYKSGKTGFVAILSMLWFSISEVVVALDKPGSLYWGGLEISQWLGVWAIIALAISLYMRAGYNVWPKIAKKR